MKKYFFVVLLFVLSFMIACGQKKEDDPKVTSNVNWGTWVTESNDKLAKYPVGGFPYKSSKVPASYWTRWAKDAAPIVKEILSKIPDDYVLQVTGHTDGSGPEEPVGDKPGNIKISNDRAKTIHDALRKAGIDSPKLTYKGVGSSESISGVNERSGQQRRVSFKVVPK